MKIARVFPRKTNMSPIDRDAYYGLPEMFMPEYNEVHISVTFTWDIEKGYQLQKEWQVVCDKVRIGGPAFDDFGTLSHRECLSKKDVSLLQEVAQIIVLGVLCRGARVKLGSYQLYQVT